MLAIAKSADCWRLSLTASVNFQRKLLITTLWHPKLEIMGVHQKWPQNHQIIYAMCAENALEKKNETPIVFTQKWRSFGDFQGPNPQRGLTVATAPRAIALLTFPRPEVLKNQEIPGFSQKVKHGHIDQQNMGFSCEVENQQTLPAKLGWKNPLL